MKEIKDIIKAYEEATLQHKKSALATVVHVEGSSYRRPGARMLVTEDGMLTGAISGGCLEGDALKKAVLAIMQNKKKLVIYDTTDEDDAKLGIQLGCNGIVSILFEPILETDNDNPIHILKKVAKKNKSSVLISGYSLNNQLHYGTCTLDNLPSGIKNELELLLKQVLSSGVSIHREIIFENNRQKFFIEFSEQSISLIIVGAGNDVMPLVSISQTLGWVITIIDGRRSHASMKRFPTVENLLVGKPHEIIPSLEINKRTAIVLMTHNYNYDLEMLNELINCDLSYIGLLGPALKRDRMLNELAEKNIFLSEEKLQTIYGPTGLDLAAETSEEIALSIIAEIMSVMKNKEPIHLKDKLQAIHNSLL